MRKEEFHLGEAILVGGRMGAVEQTIYKWKQYNAVGTNTYYWSRYNAIETIHYKWNKYSLVTTYTWSKYNCSQIEVYDTSLVNKGEYGGISSLGYSGSAFENYTLTKYGFKGTGSEQSVGGSNCMMFNNSTNKYKYWIPEAYNWKTGSPIMGVGCRATSHTWEDSSGDNRTEWHFWCNPYYNLTRIGYEYTKSGNALTTITGTDASTYPNGDRHTDGYYYEITDTAYSKGSTSYGQVTSTSSSAYPNNGASGSYWYDSAGSYSTWSKGSTSYGQISSTNSGAYPNNGNSGSYWYVYSTYTTTWSQGTYVSDRLSTDRDRWPDNGRDGDYWYVYDGEA